MIKAIRINSYQLTVLRPAAANNISIKKDKWVGDDTIGELRKLYDSIREFVKV